jgi:hypothetical protein
MAVDALVGLGHHRGMIALAIELVREGENVFRAKFDAVATPLASIIDDADSPAGYLYLLSVKRYSPKCHVAYLCDG